MLNAVRAFLFAFALAAVPGAVHADDKPLTVVELYTSQGCSSCPPADAFMGELVRRPDIIGLSFHIDYWDYIGWKDPFARPENTRRQTRYARHLGLRHVYTPQMVIQGAVNAVGSKRPDVATAIEQTKDIPYLQIGLKRAKKSDALKVVVPASDRKEHARIYLFAYDDKHTTTIKSGENGGRVLSYYNVVRSTQKIGIWTGMKIKLFVPVADMVAAGRTGCAVIVQSKETGRILGAANFRFDLSS